MPHCRPYLLTLVAVALTLTPIHRAWAEAPEVRVARELLALPDGKLNIGEAALRLGVQFVVDAPPTLFQSTRGDPGSCLPVCSNLCGPGPGNRCADFKSFDSRAAE